MTGDDSRNNCLLALLTMGEGRHNHHVFQSSVRQGFKCGKLTGPYYILKALSWLGIVWDLKTPPERVLRNEQRLGARVVIRAAEQLAGHFDPERISLAVTAALQGSELAALREKLFRAHHRAAEAMTALHVPYIPSREEFSAEATAMFARSPSLDEIVDRAYELVLASVGMRLTSGDVRCSWIPARCFYEVDRREDIRRCKPHLQYPIDREDILALARDLDMRLISLRARQRHSAVRR